MFEYENIKWISAENWTEHSTTEMTYVLRFKVTA